MALSLMWHVLLLSRLINLCITRIYLGVTINDKVYMFGDSIYVVDSGSEYYAKLHKRNTALSYHHVRSSKCKQDAQLHIHYWYG